MTSRRALNKIASIILRRVEHYVLTVKVSSDATVYVCTDVPELLTSQYFKLVTPAEFKADFLDTPLQMRLDAITTPTYPVDDLVTLVTGLLPGCGDRLGPLGKSTPSEMLEAYSDMWHEAVKVFNIPDPEPELTELRFDFGQKRYQHVRMAEDYTIPGIVGEYSLSLPRVQCYDINSSHLQRDDRYIDFFDDIAWMRRVVFELLPVRMYQRVCFGCAEVSRQTNGHIEEYSYAPVSLGSEAVDAVMRCEMHTLNHVVDLRISRPLAYTTSGNSSQAVANMNWSGCPALVMDGDRYPAGLHGLDQRILNLAAGYRPITNLDMMDQVTLNGSTPILCKKLYRLHEGDPIWEFIDQAFYDEAN